MLLHGRTARVALPVAAVVGTVLSSVNQAAVIASGHTTAGTWIRVGVNYLVPFLVSSYGYLTARRLRSALLEPRVERRVVCAPPRERVAAGR
ncbi:nitrate/nitrite transporter NrtS [Streptomyces sp. PRB2-1]|jgi:hypothetical protein|uniref:Nitrate/nitrite transporter NrtS n=2 Tax=Actinacidiphila epipremni TaxID=2053013 RepID=A0ABX0ZL60_9ACTN|nr:nitrate/nitrite transporter NrtS [Actinacidiphila epipremni]